MNMDRWSCLWWIGVTVLLGCMLFPAAALPLLKSENVMVDMSQDEKCTLCIVRPYKVVILKAQVPGLTCLST